MTITLKLLALFRAIANHPFNGWLTEEEKENIYSELSKIKNIESVNWEKGSEDYNKNGYTLYEIQTEYDSHSDECDEVYKNITEKYADDDNYELYMSGEIYDANVPPVSTENLLLALAILVVVLLVMCNSWFEPVVFLGTIAVAVIINNGTNAFLPSISDSANSIVAVMQLVLSMDYSIILMNRYTQEKERHTDKKEAMKEAIRSAFPAITSSSLTTFVGLLALVFMSFKIGGDMGIALAKSVLISLICIFTVLPSFILASDKILVKTKKKSLNIPMGGYSKIAVKGRYVISGLFLVLFVGLFIAKGNTEILYTLDTNSKVDHINRTGFRRNKYCISGSVPGSR